MSECFETVGSGVHAIHCPTAWGQWAVELLQNSVPLPSGQWAVELLQHIAALPGGSRQWAVGSARRAVVSQNRAYQPGGQDVLPSGWSSVLMGLRRGQQSTRTGQTGLRGLGVLPRSWWKVLRSR